MKHVSQTSQFFRIFQVSCIQRAEIYKFQHPIQSQYLKLSSNIKSVNIGPVFKEIFKIFILCFMLQGNVLQWSSGCVSVSLQQLLMKITFSVSWPSAIHKSRQEMGSCVQTRDGTDIRIRGYPIKISHPNPKNMRMKTRGFGFMIPEGKFLITFAMDQSPRQFLIFFSEIVRYFGF